MIHIILRACKSFMGLVLNFQNFNNLPKRHSSPLGMVFGQVFQSMGHCITLNIAYYINLCLQGCVPTNLLKDFEVVYLELGKRQRLPLNPSGMRTFSLVL